MEGERAGPTTTPISDWHYVAEGGANLVFGYHGTDPSFSGRALRIPKPSHTEESGTNRVWREELLPRLLPKAFLPEVRPVMLDPTWVSDLVKQSESCRPSHRLDDIEAIWPSSVKALLMNDLRSGAKDDHGGHKILAIEIKPKWGFTPRADFVTPPEAAAIKSQISRYRLHQHLRGHVDDYDPLDLYSGDLERIERAVAALWGIWQQRSGTANNWRVFVDGKRINPDRSDEVPGMDMSADIATRTIPLIAPALHQSGVLECLRQLQSKLDSTDISHLARRFVAEHPNVDLFDNGQLIEPDITELREVVDAYLSDPSAGRDGNWSLRQSLVAYSLSAVFKDCSVFLIIPMVPEGQKWKAVEPDVRVQVIDLDLKPLGNMRKWYDLDEKIWRHWHDTH